MKFRYLPISRKYNFGGTRPKQAIKYLAVHYTANFSNAANAYAHYRYFNNNNVGASAHIFVDDKEIIQIIGESTVAYAVGDNQGYGRALNGCTNYNSISVEMCVNKDANQNEVYKNTVAVFQALRKKYPNATICRHYDVSRKVCPLAFVRSGSAFQKFVKDVISGPVERVFDINANESEIKILGKPEAQPAPKQPKVEPIKPTEKKNILLINGEGDRAIGGLVAWAYNRCPVDLVSNASKYPEAQYNILKVGGVGHNRINSAMLALQKYLPSNFKKYLNSAKINSGFDYEKSAKPLIVMYYADGDKPIADLIGYKHNCDVVPDTEENSKYHDTHMVMYVGRGTNRITSAFEALAKYAPDEYLEVAGYKPSENKMAPDKELIIVYNDDADKPVADYLAYHYKCDSTLKTDEIVEKYNIIEVKNGHDRLDTLLYNISKHMPEKYRRYSM